MGLQQCSSRALHACRISLTRVRRTPRRYVTGTCNHRLRLDGWVLHVVRWIASTMLYWEGVDVVQVSLGET